MLKIRRSRDRLIFNMAIPILVRRHLYIELALWFSLNWHREHSSLAWLTTYLSHNWHYKHNTLNWLTAPYELRHTHDTRTMGFRDKYLNTNTSSFYIGCIITAGTDGANVRGKWSMEMINKMLIHFIGNDNELTRVNTSPSFKTLRPSGT